MHDAGIIASYEIIIIMANSDIIMRDESVNLMMTFIDYFTL